MKHLFIINPKAGKYNHADELVPLIERCMSDCGETYKTVVTERPMHAAQLVRAHAADGDEWRVYVCGGDGTLNEATDGAAGLKNVAITQYPCGTGNDFIKIFGRDAARFADLTELVLGDVRQLDLIECGGRHCVNICSLGFDARIAQDVARFKRLPLLSGKGAYNLSLVKNLFGGLHYPYQVRIDGVPYDGRYTMLVACNGRFYGGGFNPVPEAMPDDGLIDFLLVRPVTPMTVALVVGKYQNGQHEELPEYMTWVRGKRMDIVCDRPNAVNFDGETERVRSASFSLSEKKLNFIVPVGATWKSTNDMLKTNDIERKQEHVTFSER